MEVRRALVTGVTGFVGSHLAVRLVETGWDVHLIVRPGSYTDMLETFKEKVTIYRHDGSTGGMQNIVQLARPSVVFHLASLYLTQHKTEDIVPLIRSNIIFSTQLVEAMTVYGVSLLINTGTSWQHFENADYCPVNLYAATKQAFESILQFYLETTPLKVVTLKLFDTYGPCDTRPKLLSLLRKVAEGQQPLAMSPGGQLIDLVYIDDVTEAFLLTAERLLHGTVQNHERYAVSSGKPVKLREVVETYERVIGKKLPIEWGGRPYREREVMMPWSYGDKLPGWEPRVCLEEGLAKMFSHSTNASGKLS